MKNRFGLFTGIAMALCLSAGVISAQEGHPGPERIMLDKVEHLKLLQEHQYPPMTPGGDVLFIASEMSFDGRLVKGAPYSAEAITETTQVLSDGNRIVNKSTASVYRDSEGRTRREQALKAIGPFGNNGAPWQTIHISDPVAGVSFMLNPRLQVAHKMPPMRFKFSSRTASPDWAPGSADAKGTFHIQVPPEAGVMGKRVTEMGIVVGGVDKNNPNSKAESLGKQNIGGVEAEGTRTTVTIPAGEIGNERAIEIVTERWYSPELQIVVMTRHSDPRFGENNYRLTNIDRSEPVRSLFEVPAGYKVEGPSWTPVPGQKIQTRKPIDEQ